MTKKKPRKSGRAASKARAPRGARKTARKPSRKAAAKPAKRKKTTARKPRDDRWLSRTLVRSANALSRQNPDGSVSVMHLENETYMLKIDGIAAEVWQLIDGKTPLSSICEKLIEKHEAPEKLLKADLRRFVAHLERENLLET